MREHDATELAYKNGYEKGRVDAIREMQERLTKDAYPFPCAIGVEYAVPICKIDQTAKEIINKK